MSSDTFVLEVKSTLDKIMMDIRQDFEDGGVANIKGVDLDDIKQVDIDLGGTDPCVVWQLASLDQHPRDPLWMMKFAAGVKTTADKGNYNLAEFMSKISASFAIDKIIEIYDYSEDTPDPTKVGTVTVCSHEINPQQFDHQSGLRLLVINSKVIRCG